MKALADYSVDEILALPPGPELDALADNCIHGQRCAVVGGRAHRLIKEVPASWSNWRTGYSLISSAEIGRWAAEYVPAYSTDIAAVWPLQAKAVEKDAGAYANHLEIVLYRDDPKRVLPCFDNNPIINGMRVHTLYGSTASVHARCRAAVITLREVRDA